MKVDAKSQDALDNLVRNCKSVQEKNKADRAINSLISSATFEKTPDEYGGSYYIYSAVIENISGISFGNVSLVLALYDADGVKAEGTYASTSSWGCGGEGAFRSHQFCRRRPGQSDGLELRSGGVSLYKG